MPIIRLNNCIKTYTFGQDKAISPEKTIENIILKLNETKIPILQEVLSIEKFDRIDIPAFICKINKDLKNELGLNASFGKGVTIEQAKASALMEVIERYSCTSFLMKDNNFIITPYFKVKDKTCNLEDLLLPLDKNYKNSTVIINDLAQTPLCFTKSFSLTEGKDLLFPLRWFSYIYATTGFAAGNSVEEAILQALCEVVERHAISCVVKKKVFPPSIEINSIENHIARELISKFHKAGIKLFIKDFSLGIEIPTIGVLAYDADTSFETIKIYNAAGTHLNRANALIRALTELAQHRCQMLYRKIVEKKKGGPTYCFPAFKNLDEARYLANENKKVRFSDLPNYVSNDFKKEIKRAVRILSDNKFEVVVTDATHSSFKIPAVIVTIPGSKLNIPTTKMNPYFIMAQSCMEIDRYKEAIESFEKAFELDPWERNNPKMLCRLGLCYKKIRNYRMAIQLIEKALRLNPKLASPKKLIQDISAILRQS